MPVCYICKIGNVRAMPPLDPLPPKIIKKNEIKFWIQDLVLIKSLFRLLPLLSKQSANKIITLLSSSAILVQLHFWTEVTDLNKSNFHQRSVQVHVTNKNYLDSRLNEEVNEKKLPIKQRKVAAEKLREIIQIPV